MGNTLGALNQMAFQAEKEFGALTPCWLDCKHNRAKALATVSSVFSVSPHTSWCGSSGPPSLPVFCTLSVLCKNVDAYWLKLKVNGQHIKIRIQHPCGTAKKVCLSRCFSLVMRPKILFLSLE
uniref:Uncharacterized protein n=1 Tax=Anguilla anguilla TaxID=7936 RepID=A0A0E9X1P3_ANGAN